MTGGKSRVTFPSSLLRHWGRSVLPEVRAAAGADRIRPFRGQALAMLAEDLVVPDFRKRLAQHVAADQLEAGGDIAVGEDVGADPGAAWWLAMGEPLRLMVIDAHLLPVQIRIDQNGDAEVCFLQAPGGFVEAVGVDSLGGG